MVYDVNISKEQAKYIKTEISHFCATTDTVSIKIQPHDFVCINSKHESIPKIIAWISRIVKYNDADDLINHDIFNYRISSNEAKEIITAEIRNLFTNNNEVYGYSLSKIYSDDNPISEIALYVATKFLYRSIMFFRHLPLKKKFFKYKMDANIEKRFFEEIDKAKILLSVLKNEIEFDRFLNNVTVEYKTNPPEDPELLSLLDLGITYPPTANFILNNTRMTLIMDTENEINKIIKAYESKNYLKIREIGYDIHNFPTMIRTMNDWRLK